MVRQGFVAVEKGPARRSDLVVVALRRGVHAELGRAVSEVVARPVAQTALDGLKHAAPRGTTRRPSSGQRALRRKRLVLVVGVVRRDPRAGQANLKASQRPVDQRPDRGVEPHARTELGSCGRPRRAEADIAVQPVGMGGDLGGSSFLDVVRLVLLCGTVPGQEGHAEAGQKSGSHSSFLILIIASRSLVVGVGSIRATRPGIHASGPRSPSRSS